jgi:hypothetical protein
MKARWNRFIKFGVLIAALAAAPALAAAAEITVSLDPQRMAVSDSAQLTLTVKGSEDAAPKMPIVKGLEITLMGQSSSMESINGQVSNSVSFLYQVTADHAGTFTIPAIHLPDGSSSEPVKLSVSKTAGGAGMAAANLPAPHVKSENGGVAAQSSDQPAFLQVVIPKRQFYVGERVPVQVKAYFRADVTASLSGLPSLSSDAFTLNKLDDKPSQTQEMVGGLPYTVVTWSSALSAVKSGDYDLHLELPIAVAVPDKSRRDDALKQFFGDSGIDDPALNDFFGGTTEKSMTLQADVSDLKVMPLPTDGRPSGFNGAVGHFEVTAEAAPTQLTVGDPITLRLHVTGQGNFDRVQFRGLEASPEWKSYSPKAQFDPADDVGYAGTKTFEQAVIPLASGQREIPAMAFSYFDPDTRHYEMRATKPISIDIAPGNNANAAGAGPASLSATSTALASAHSAVTDLAPNEVEVGRFISTLRPLIFAPWFIVMPGVPVSLLIIGLVVHHRRKRLALDPERARSRTAKAALQEKLAAMDQAVAANSAPAFFTAARHAVQEQMAWRWHLSASQVTTAEIDRRLNGQGSGLRDLFAVADDIVYSGRKVPQSELLRWKETVMHQLKNLEQ